MDSFKLNFAEIEQIAGIPIYKTDTYSYKNRLYAVGILLYNIWYKPL